MSGGSEAVTPSGFRTALSSAKLVELDVEVNPSVASDIEAFVGVGGVLLVGETHGVAENASIVAWLYERFGFRRLVLEWRDELAPLVDAYARGGEPDLGRMAELNRGCFYDPNYFVLLRHLTVAGRLDHLTLCDGPAELGPGEHPQNARDRHMAQRLIRGLEPGSPTLAALGSLHVLTDPVDLASDATVATTLRSLMTGQSTLWPTGALVAQVAPTRMLLISYGTGAYVNAGKTHALSHGEPITNTSLRTRRALLTGDDQWVFELPVATPTEWAPGHPPGSA